MVKIGIGVPLGQNLGCFLTEQHVDLASKANQIEEKAQLL
jgi:hypothetical protein